MPRVCTVCTHSERDAIDADLVAGVPNRRIATQRVVSEAAVRRHKADHLPARLVKAAEKKEVATAAGLLEQMRALQAKTLAILDAATDHRISLGAIREARGNVALLAELTGQLATQPTVNVLVSAEWVMVRSALLEALLSFPEAPAAVSARLLALGNGGGT